MANSSLGVYFGPKIINLVETSGKKILNNIQMQRSLFAPSDLEPQISDEIKIVALFNEELRRNKIEVKEANFCLSGKDLIIRTFDIPLLPADEIPNGVNFEVRKYIPFKIEDLVSDFQVSQDKVSRRNQVLYVGIKKETLEKYFSIANQLNIKVNAIEYSVFSLLRFLSLANFNSRGVVAVFNVDYLEEDEANFIILENGFPLFSRDIVISASPEEIRAAQETPLASLLEKLKTEIRVSLDYYNRTFFAKKISKVHLIMNNDLRPDMEGFFKNLSLPVNSIDISKYIPRNQVFSLGLVKSCGCSFPKNAKGELKINLLSARVKTRVGKEAMPGVDFKAIFAAFKIDTRVIIIGLLICLLSFAYGIYRKIPVKNELENIIKQTPKVLDVPLSAQLTDLEALNVKLNKQKKDLNDLIVKQPYLTEILNVLPRLSPERIRLTKVSYSLKSAANGELQLKGVSDTGENDQELKLINSFLVALKDDPVFKKYFENISLSNIGHQDQVSGTNFVISCKKQEAD
jgi:hypothetical protein